MPRFRKGSFTQRENFGKKHRFEHWCRDNTVYLITSKCQRGSFAFRSEAAKAIFWDRFTHYTVQHGFAPFVTSLIHNHYHTLGYLKVGEELPEMMRKLHGSVAKLVNDVLSKRLIPFWYDGRRQNYFDGCIRSETQCRRAYRYILAQSVRARLVSDWREYPHTRVNVDLERAVKRANELRAFMEGVPYKRYEGRK